MKTVIIIIVVAILVVAGLGAGGVYLWKTLKEPEIPQTEVKIPVEKGLGEIPETTGIEPEAEIFPEEPGDQATVVGEIAPETEPSLEEGLGVESEDISGDITGAPVTRDIAAVTEETPEELRDTRPPAAPSGRPGQPSELTTVEPAVEPTSTPVPTTSAITPTPTPTPTPGPAPGNYSVRTIEPVFESQLAAVRKAMKSLGVSLQEQKVGQQRLQAYRIAVGYFRTKAEAESWAQYNFRPRETDYYVYPVQGMFSIQVGVYAQQQNVEPAMRELYRKFPGWRLPIRREITTIAKSAYELSISRITESLADKIWRELNRLGIQTSITGS